jgi:hypothetical protein
VAESGAAVTGRATTGGNVVVFRHELAVVSLAGLALVAVLVVLRESPDERAVAASGLLAALLLGAAVGAYPAAVVDDAGVTLRNPWRTTRVGWAAVTDVRMGWTLTVSTATAVHRAWAVPGPRRMRSMWERHWTEQEEVFERDSLPALQAASARGEGLLGLGDAALIVAQRWAARAALCPPEPDRVTASVPGRVLLALAAVTAVVTAALAV